MLLSSSLGRGMVASALQGVGAIALVVGGHSCWWQQVPQVGVGCGVKGMARARRSAVQRGFVYSCDVMGRGNRDSVRGGSRASWSSS